MKTKSFETFHVFSSGHEKEKPEKVCVSTIIIKNYTIRFLVKLKAMAFRSSHPEVA